MLSKAVSSRWLAFNAVGLTGVLVQLSVLAALTRGAGLDVAVATLLAVEAAVLHNFFWHQRWTWRDRPAAGRREVAGRLVRFHAANGFVSFVGNIAITAWLAGLGLEPVLANLIAIIACSLVNFAAGDLVVFRTTAAILFVAAAATPLGAQSSAALKGWQDYTAAVDRRHANAGATEFFALDLRKVRGWRERAKGGGIPMVEVKPPGIPHAKMHHWAGAVYVPKTTVDAVVKRMQDGAGRESESYEEVKASKLLERNGDRLRVFMRIERDATLLTVTYNTEHEVEYRRLGNRATSRSVSTKIAELANAGTPKEREKRAGDDHGFLWRLNAYWRFEQWGDGVLIECESVSLSRHVPLIARPVVGPIANRIARESLERTMRSLRRFVS
ncbi:MAG: GtrA family protein [Vicinamibacterales bacterium]